MRLSGQNSTGRRKNEPENRKGRLFRSGTIYIYMELNLWRVCLSVVYELHYNYDRNHSDSYLQEVGKGAKGQESKGHNSRQSIPPYPRIAGGC